MTVCVCVSVFVCLPRCLVTSAVLLAGSGAQRAAGASDRGDESRGHNLNQWDKTHTRSHAHTNTKSHMQMGRHAHGLTKN